MEVAIKSVLPVYAMGLWMYTGKILMPFPTNKDHQSPALAGEGGGGFSYCCGNKMVSKHLIRAINHLTINQGEK